MTIKKSLLDKYRKRIKVAQAAQEDARDMLNFARSAGIDTTSLEQRLREQNSRLARIEAAIKMEEERTGE